MLWEEYGVLMSVCRLVEVELQGLYSGVLLCQFAGLVWVPESFGTTQRGSTQNRFVCTYISIWLQAAGCIHASIPTYMHTDTDCVTGCVYGCMTAHLRSCIPTCTHIHAHVYTSLYMSVYVHISCIQMCSRILAGVDSLMITASVIGNRFQALGEHWNQNCRRQLYGFNTLFEGTHVSWTLVHLYCCWQEFSL